MALNVLSRIRIGGLAALAVAAIAGGLSGTDSALAVGTVIRLSPAPSVVGFVGGDGAATIDIRVDDVVGLGHFQFKLSWNPTYATCGYVTPSEYEPDIPCAEEYDPDGPSGPLLPFIVSGGHRTGGCAIVTPLPIVDSVTFGCYTYLIDPDDPLGPYAGVVSGSGLLAQVHLFYTGSLGTSALTLDSNYTFVAEADGDILPSTLQGTSLIFIECPDINLKDTAPTGDGVFVTDLVTSANYGHVVFEDFSRLAASYGRASGHPLYNVSADLTDNGTVDFADFGVLAKGYGKTCPTHH